MSTQPPSKSGPRRAFRVGKYQILSSATIKALGQVHRARDEQANRDVLLMVLTGEISTNKARQEALQRLHGLASNIEHDHLLTAIDCGNVHGTWYMALEWIEPVDLHDYVEKKQTVPMSDVVQIARQLAEALQRLHDTGHVHGNVRPGTILIGNQAGSPVVKLLHPALVRQPRSDEWRSTVGGLKVGAVDYQAPEVLENREAADIRSDLYSLGCVLYHMLAGRPPYADANPGERAGLHREGRYPNISNFNSSVSQELAALSP
jgi:serine/threonine-protein kinase